MEPTKQFDKGNVVSTRDYGFEEDYKIHLERSFEGGWVASCPECGLSETGNTREEAIAHVVDNLRLFHKPKYKI
ncbi:MAG: hypothetical protein GEEBNDBF_00778 [bacterium]|nr:hypothetical protein [bacterium]